MQDFSGAPPTPQPEGRTGGGSDDRHGPAGGELFPDAASDFGLKPRPKARRVDPLLGTDLGGITITRLLGEGGMGRVYEARQEDPPRTVAVKVIRQGIASEKTMRRFEREAEFLGRLQHPGIARIYVVGSYSSDDGDVPFFVMEYIPNARPINHYASENNLSLADRLRLFVSVCEAVSHGHDRGIVHRDLKPGNILIDSNGLPKVIDFGVARSTDSDFSLTSMKTDTGQLVGTVQYMSPEQFGDSPEGLDGRADVYSLGVVLYELLAGVLPYEVRKKKMHDAARIICEEIPPPLRGRDRAVPRDVSLIVERCLEKNRRRRYQGAAALAADIRQHLSGERLAITWKDRLRPVVRVAWRRWLPVVLIGVTVLAAATVVMLGRVPTAPVSGESPVAVPIAAAVPEAVKDSLRAATDSLRESSGNAAAAMKHAQDHVDQRVREVRMDACKSLLSNAGQRFNGTADGFARELDQALLDAVKAYPSASEGDLTQRCTKWREELLAIRSSAQADLAVVTGECQAILAATETSPVRESIRTAEQGIKDKLDQWNADWEGRLRALVGEATEDLLALSRQSSGKREP